MGLRSCVYCVSYSSWGEPLMQSIRVRRCSLGWQGKLVQLVSCRSEVAVVTMFPILFPLGSAEDLPGGFVCGRFLMTIDLSA